MSANLYFDELINECIKSSSNLTCFKKIEKYSGNLAFELHLDEWIQGLTNWKSNGKIIKLLIECSRWKSMIIRDSCVTQLGFSITSKRIVSRALVDRIGDKSWVVRCSAMYALALQRDIKSSKLIMLRYNSWSHIEREWVLISLTILRDPSTRLFLENIFSRTRRYTYKLLSAGALSALGDAKYRLFLEKSYHEEKSKECLDDIKQIFDMLNEMGNATELPRSVG
jgi:hypothetical protein